MDFQKLLTKMQELDAPATETVSITDEGGCGMTPPPLSAAPAEPDVPPPSMSVNINAQGLENIEDMMKLFTKVNPDMMPPAASPMPTLSPIDTMSIKPELPPLKMLPDMDADNDDKVGGELDLPPDHDKDHMMIKTLDKDGDGDHDMDDHDKERKEEWENEPDEQTQDVDYMVNKLSGGLGRKQGTYTKVAGADNPMQRVKENTDLRSKIREELLRRLEESKGE